MCFVLLFGHPNHRNKSRAETDTPYSSFPAAGTRSASALPGRSALLHYTPWWCSSSPPDSASPSFSFYHPSPSPPHHTLAVRNLSCPFPSRTCSALLAPFSSCFFSAASAPHEEGGGLLKSVSFTASSSNILAVVGPSGAGKSTLLRILSGRGTGTEISEKPGTVSLNGRAVTSRARLRRLCGFVTQDDNLLPLLTVRETVLFAARFRLRGADAHARRERVDALLHELGLSDVADSYVGGGADGSSPRGVSGGERKRVSVAVDLVHDPPVLLLDEPTSGLDSRSALDVLALLRDVARARRQVVVLSIHQPSYRMLGYISSLLLLSRGAVAHSGTLKSLEDALARLGHKHVPVQLNPLELAMEVTAQLQDDHAKHHHHFEDDLVSGNIVDIPDEHGYCGRATEVAALTVRCWRVMRRTRELFAGAGRAGCGGGPGPRQRLLPHQPDGPGRRGTPARPLRLHAQLPPLLHRGGPPRAPPRAPRADARRLAPRVPPLLLRARQRARLRAMPPRRLPPLLAPALLARGPPRLPRQRLRVLRARRLARRARGQLARALPQRRRAGLRRGKRAHLRLPRRLLPLLRLLHPAGQHPGLLGVHVLRLHVQIPARPAAHQRVRRRRKGQVRRVGGQRRRRVLEDRGRRAQGQRHRRGDEVGQRRGHDRLLPALQGLVLGGARPEGQEHHTLNLWSIASSALGVVYS
ncbi:hypothetical protein PR202_ga04513 [Eleusine coracana subsp. coracana]|uniref:ABC transporter domain-containing protein n=1 Tax=Eleusine coracana subsp. coracana TaxID=191504 RepID=A0AAV5BSH4_ELECO|nr:hypothetical protein PR202_ga04513 [Eleusine coracana subsp. coracana]